MSRSELSQAKRGARRTWPRSALVLTGFTFIFLALQGCGTEESDTSPPDFIINAAQSQGKYRYGVTDTIAVDFSEDIDTASVALDFSDTAGIGHRFATKRRLHIYGTQSHQGTRHFPVKTPFSLTVRGVADLDGNALEEFQASFQPYAWIDRDFQERGYPGLDSLFATDSTWGGGASQKDTLVLEGSLDFNELATKYWDLQDIKLAHVYAPDTLDMVLTTRKDLDLKIQALGPFASVDTLDSDRLDFRNSIASAQTSNTGRAAFRLATSYESHDRTLGSPAAKGFYAIRISILTPDYEGFYRLQVVLKRLKK